MNARQIKTLKEIANKNNTTRHVFKVWGSPERRRRAWPKGFELARMLHEMGSNVRERDFYALFDALEDAGILRLMRGDQGRALRAKLPKGLFLKDLGQAAVGESEETEAASLPIKSIAPLPIKEASAKLQLTTAADLAQMQRELASGYHVTITVTTPSGVRIPIQVPKGVSLTEVAQAVHDAVV